MRRLFEAASQIPRSQQEKIFNFTWESSTVNICDGICDSCDRYGIESCEFYDTSPEATKRFLLALNYEQSAEFQFAKPN
jgi:hypothetical protein